MGQEMSRRQDRNQRPPLATSATRFDSKFSYKSSPNIVQLRGFFEKCHFVSKNCFGYFFASFGKYLATFYSHFWSHWCRRPELKNVEFSFKMADCSLQSCGPCYKANMVVGTVGKVSLAVYFINKRTPPKVSIWSATV